jgi:hypothetical protein
MSPKAGASKKHSIRKTFMNEMSGEKQKQQNKSENMLCKMFSSPLCDDFVHVFI